MRLPFSKDPLAQAGAITLLLLLAVGILGAATGLFGSPSRLGGTALHPPSLNMPFGTDNLGRSVFARTVAGIKQSILLSAIAVLIAVVAGAALGMCAGYFRGLVDEAVGRLADALFSFPAVVLAILISAIFRPGPWSAIAAVALVTLPIVTRVVRAATLNVAHRDFVTQARIAGSSHVRTLLVHILPNVGGAIAVQTAYSVSFGMIIESGISFVGLGVQPPNASLGSLLLEGRPYLAVAPWLALIPGAVLAVTILSVNFVGDGLRRTFYPAEE
jgi:peptide/nickel transport system permease protein